MYLKRIYFDSELRTYIYYSIRRIRPYLRTYSWITINFKAQINSVTSAYEQLTKFLMLCGILLKLTKHLIYIKQELLNITYKLELYLNIK